MDTDKITEIATALADEVDSDILLYNGAIGRPYDIKVINECSSAKRRKNVVLILCSYGGDPSVGYRIARCLQQKYSKFTVIINGLCKSAGTLITVGAHEIIMSDHGEIGPLDIQIGKKDEIWENDSGLTVLSAIKKLEEKSFELFETCFLELKSRSGGRITLKTATEIASKLAIGTITPIVAQIDPMHVGEVSRAMNIGFEYGRRLEKESKNTKEGTLKKLTDDYPSHGFVIDRKEAEELFENIRIPNEKENELLSLLDHISRIPYSDQAAFAHLSIKLEEQSDEDNHRGNDTEGQEITGRAISTNEDSGEEAGSTTQIEELRQISGKRRAKS